MQSFRGTNMLERRVSDSPWYWDRVHLFDGVDEAAQQMFLRHAIKQTVRKGQHLFRADDDADKVFYLEDGMARIYHLSSEGELTIYWYCVAGELFGAGGITGCRKQTVNSQAISQCTVYVMLRPIFEQMLKLNPQISYNALKLMGARLRLACDTIVDMRSQKASERVALALLRLAHNCGVPIGEHIKLDAPITHQEIANIVGTCRQTVSEVLRDLEKRGYIAQESRQIIVTDPRSMQRYVQFDAADDDTQLWS